MEKKNKTIKPEKEPREEFFNKEELEKINKNKEQKNMKWLWLIIILILMITGVYGSYWYFSKERTTSQKETTEETKETETSTTPSSEESLEKEEDEETKETTKKVYVNATDGLNLRNEPNSSASIATSMLNGAELEFIEESKDGLWYKVKYEDQTGWCYKEHISETKP